MRRVGRCRRTPAPRADRRARDRQRARRAPTARRWVDRQSREPGDVGRRRRGRASRGGPGNGRRSDPAAGGTTRHEGCSPRSTPPIRTNASPGSPISCRSRHLLRHGCRSVGSIPETSRRHSTFDSSPPIDCATSPRLAWRTLPYAFERADLKMHGPVALDLTGPSGDNWRFDPDASPAHDDPWIRGRVLRSRGSPGGSRRNQPRRYGSRLGSRAPSSCAPTRSSRSCRRWAG